MNPALHVQIIRTVWSKQSRGAPGATARTSVPLWFPVASETLRRDSLSVELYNFGEPNFAQAQNYWAEAHDVKEEKLYFGRGAFQFNWDGSNATTNWQWSWHQVGAPEPRVFDRKMGHYEVLPDSWVRLRWHGRFSDEDNGDWWYQQTVVNLARCDGELNVSFAGEPARCFQWLPQLW